MQLALSLDAKKLVRSNAGRLQWCWCSTVPFDKVPTSGHVVCLVQQLRSLHCAFLFLQCTMSFQSVFILYFEKSRNCHKVSSAGSTLNGLTKGWRESQLIAVLESCSLVSLPSHLPVFAQRILSSVCSSQVGTILKGSVALKLGKLCVVSGNFANIAAARYCIAPIIQIVYLCQTVAKSLGHKCSDCCSKSQMLLHFC